MPRTRGPAATLPGSSVLVRADFNVPITDGVDHRRPAHPRRAAHASSGCSSQGAEVTACTHLGRPKGAPDPKYSVAPVRARLAELAPGVELLENLRFDPGETANDPAFVERADRRPRPLRQRRVRRLAPGRTPRSSGRRTFLPSAAGRLLAKEVEVLLGLRDDPARPFVAITGGSKVSDKLGVIDARCSTSPTTSSSAAGCASRSSRRMGHSIGNSLFEPDQIDDLRGSCSTSTATGCTCRATSSGWAPAASSVDPVGRRRGAQLRSLAARRLDGPRHRPRHRGRVRRHHPRGPHDPVERPDGRVRGPPVRGRHPSRGRGRGRVPRLLGDRRWRHRRRGRPSSAWPTGSTTSRPVVARRSS